MSIIKLTQQHLSDLSSTKDYGKIAERLQVYAGYQVNTPAVFKNYHDILLFYCAFPPGKNISALAASELKRITTGISSPMKISLMGSGIAHTQLLCAYSSPIASWLIKKFPDAVEFGLGDASKETVRTILQLLLPVVEYERTTQGELSLIARLKFISGLQKPADLLKFLLQLFENSQLPVPVKDALYLQLKVYIQWNLTNEQFSRTFLRWPVKKIKYQQSLLKKITSSLIVKQKIGLPVSLTSTDRSVLLDTMKASLVIQYREIDPISYADEEELELFETGNGLMIAIVGMKKEKRLALESYIGFMAFKNGVPVSYGGGWIWGQRCKIGVNIYPPFRRGESAWLFCQVLRIYYQYFQVRHFIVKPYQFGKGNPEGLKSGAFWFYYKLGFRPANETIKTAAAIEWEKTQMTKNHRTPLKILQQFTGCNLEWVLSKNAFPSFDAGIISGAISNMINTDFCGNRNIALKTCIKKMKVNFPAASLKHHTLSLQEVLSNWCLLAQLIKDLPNWTQDEKRSFVELVHQKQTGKESVYINQLQKHERLWKSLEQVYATMRITDHK